MSIDSRPSDSSSPRTMGPGVHKAIVVSHLDPSYMGALECTLSRDQGNTLAEDTQTITLKCAMPFYGSTGFSFMGDNKAADTDAKTGYNDTQKSYGMWFVPPDVGVTVLCMFVGGDISDGYWFACVPDRFANHMIPAIGGSLEVDITADDKKKYNTDMPLPVAEINRVANDLTTNLEISKIKKPVHPIADRFLEQGLLEDDCRGTSPSTVRRNLPNMVFGISTPGPLDQEGKKSFIGKKNSKTPKPVPVSRLGGTQIVMDDGDDQYQRKKPASAGGVDYADTDNEEKGDPTIPYSEYFRIRTRTGHQLLMHNSEDLIYIGNARGTAWIELTANGKIDIFSDDSISIHTQNDLNIRADRDINLEGGRNVNIRATGVYRSPTELHGERKPTDNAGFENGRVQIESAFNYNLIVGGNGKVQIDQNYDRIVVNDAKMTTIGSLDIKTGGNTKITTIKDIDILSGGNHTEQATRIDMNGPKAKEAVDAVSPIPLSQRENFLTDTKLGWEKKYQDTRTISSIMRRMPMHEPWLGHENFAPEVWSKENTDREFE